MSALLSCPLKTCEPAMSGTGSIARLTFSEAWLAFSSIGPVHRRPFAKGVTCRIKAAPTLIPLLEEEIS